jgi:hypothetical protein
MPLRASVIDRALDLPPPFSLITLRESGDAFAHACKVAGDVGAGTLVWTRRFDLAEFAVGLEPEEPLATARRVHYAGMNALLDALAVHAPPNMPIAFDWPDAIRVDGVLVGGGRLGWPDCGEEDVPPWLVFGAMIRTAVMRAGDPGLRPLLGALDEVGFQEIDAGEVLASFARHLKAGMHDWEEQGFGIVERRYLERMASGSRNFASGETLHGDDPHSPAPRVGFSHSGKGREPVSRLDEIGDLSTQSDDQGQTSPRSLREALLAPSWLDLRTGMPWL